MALLEPSEEFPSLSSDERYIWNLYYNREVKIKNLEYR